MWQGSDGGLASSWDMGKTWQHVSNISLGQFYHVYADNRKPFYFVSGGTQDNGTWIGPSQTREPAGIMNDEWRMISTIVGFNTLSETDDPDIVLQPDARRHAPAHRPAHPRSAIHRPAGAQLQRRRHRADEIPLRLGRAAGALRVSAKTRFYYGSNVIFQSSDKGSTWEPISHDLTNADPDKWKPSGGPIFTDNSASEVYGAVTHISESPRQTRRHLGRHRRRQHPGHNQRRRPMDQRRSPTSRRSVALARLRAGDFASQSERRLRRHSIVTCSTTCVRIFTRQPTPARPGPTSPPAFPEMRSSGSCAKI